MVVNGRPVKRAKRRVTADLYDFFTFPSDAAARDLDGPFRSNIQVFLSRHARLLPLPSILPLSPPPAGHLLTWQIGYGLGDGDVGYGEEPLSPAEAAAMVTIELDVVEEDVARSKSIYCDQCRVVGWSCHPVCRKRYHFIIRNTANPLSSYNHKCVYCKASLSRMDSRCHSCNYDLTAENLEDWACNQLEDPTHLLHGLVHSNGFGHLLRVNGQDGGSKYLTGSDIMDFWDRLCKMLHVRKVTVMDISKKHGMEYRLLSAVITGQPWYGRWGFQFGAGSFGVTKQAYQEAVGTLGSLPLSHFFSHSRLQRTAMENLIALYSSLSDRPMGTLWDLFGYINHLLHDAREHFTPAKKLQHVAPLGSLGALSSWTKLEVEKAEAVMMKILRAVGRTNWITWRALKGAASGSVGSPELLDYCLKGLAGKLTEDQLVVQSRYNENTSAVEFRLDSFEILVDQVQRGDAIKLPPDQLLCHFKFLYYAILDPTTTPHNRPCNAKETARKAARNILDCKQFIKEYDDHFTHLPNPLHQHIWCHVELNNEPADYTSPPAELITLPANAAIADLKFQAGKAFRETYLLFQRFQPEQVLSRDKASNIKLVTDINDGGTVLVKGSCLAGKGKLDRFRMERGTESWEVDCPCGAKDDDGERMMACDECGVWQHTRCAGIDDQEKVPENFICIKCTGCCIDAPPPDPGGERGKLLRAAATY